MQNATARLITGTRCRDHITPVLCELHWLPIRECVKFKVACLVCQSLSGQAPLYLADDCCVSDSTQRSLLSADIPTCVVPRTLSSYSDRTFCSRMIPPAEFSSSSTCNPDITYGLFRRQLKGHLFREARTLWCSVTLICGTFEEHLLTQVHLKHNNNNNRFTALFPGPPG